MPRDILLAVVLGAHGVKGEVRVKTFTGKPEDLGAYGPLHCADGRIFKLARCRAGKDGEAVAAFLDVSGREAAEALKGTELFVKRGTFPAPPDGEFYHADLIGLAVADAEGREIGKVSAIHNFGAGDVLAIACAGGDEILLAFTRENVPQIDVKTGRIVVALPNEVDAGDEGGA